MERVNLFLCCFSVILIYLAMQNGWDSFVVRFLRNFFFLFFAPMTVEVTQLMCLDHNSVKYSVSVWGEFFEYLYIQ